MLSLIEMAVDMAEADAYAQSRGHTDWLEASASPDTGREAALRRGQDYIAGRYNARWNIEFDNDDAPEAVKFAIVEAARLELSTAGSLQPNQTETLGQLKRIKERVEGAVEREREFMEGGVASARPVFLVIDDLLAGLVRSGSSVWLSRV
jgi:hypothetical protein